MIFNPSSEIYLNWLRSLETEDVVAVWEYNLINNRGDLSTTKQVGTGRITGIFSNEARNPDSIRHQVSLGKELVEFVDGKISLRKSGPLENRILVELR